MNYIIRYFINPQAKKNEESGVVPGQYYPFPVYGTTIDMDDFTREISHATSLTPSDVHAVVVELVEIFSRHLAKGDKVKVNGIGTFKVSFSGYGAPSPEDVSATNIDRSSIKITFVSDSSLKQEVRAQVSFTKAAAAKKSDGASPATNSDAASAD